MIRGSKGLFVVNSFKNVSKELTDIFEIGWGSH